MVEPPGTHVTKLYTLCYLCNDVVREGSMRFKSAHSDWMQNKPIRMHDLGSTLPIFAMMWFEEVRCT